MRIALFIIISILFKSYIQGQNSEFEKIKNLIETLNSETTDCNISCKNLKGEGYGTDINFGRGTELMLCNFSKMEVLEIISLYSKVCPNSKRKERFIKKFEKSLKF